MMSLYNPKAQNCHSKNTLTYVAQGSGFVFVSGVHGFSFAQPERRRRAGHAWSHVCSRGWVRGVTWAVSRAVTLVAEMALVGFRCALKPGDAPVMFTDTHTYVHTLQQCCCLGWFWWLISTYNIHIIVFLFFFNELWFKTKWKWAWHSKKKKKLKVIWLQIKSFVLSLKNEIKLKKNKLIFASLIC